MKTKEEVLDLAKNVARIEYDRIREERFKAMVAFHTEGDVPRLLFYPELSDRENTRPQIAWSFRVLGASLDELESIVFVSDSYFATAETKTDGTPWAPGDMQYAWENKTVDAQLIKEALTYQVISREGAAMVSVNYVREQDGSLTFLWDDAHVFVEGDGDGHLGGFFADCMKDAIDQPPLMNLMKDAGIDHETLGLDLEAARIHSMCVGVKMVLRESNMPCMVLCRNEHEAEIVKHSMEDGPFSEGISAYDQDQLLEITTLEEAYDKPAYDEPRPMLRGFLGDD